MKNQEQQQHERDWGAFSEMFHKREGFYTNKKDPKAKELFFWFTSGAGHEASGLLKGKQKSF